LKDAADRVSTIAPVVSGTSLPDRAGTPALTCVLIASAQDASGLEGHALR
jgi:hypothetical protein